MAQLRNLFFFSFIFIVMGCKSSPATEVSLISAADAEILMSDTDVQLLDVRTPSEYSEGHIADAQNIDFWNPDFEKEIEGLDKSKPVLVYCKSGGRSAKSAFILKAKGFKSVYDLKGGISLWLKAGLAVEQ